MKFHGELSGYKVSFEDGRYTLYDTDDAVLKESTSLDAIEKFLNDRGKEKKKKFKRIAIITEGYSEGFKKGEATSPAESGTYPYVWVIVNGQRSKESCSSVYLDTPKNQIVFEKIKVLQKEIKELEEKKTDLYSHLQKITHADFEEDK